MKYNILHDKTLNFAVRIVKLYKYLVKTQKEYDLPRQILRSGTSIGANSRESRSAQSTADFINKLQIAMKECYETDYWLDIFHETNTIDTEIYEKLFATCSKIRKLLTASITTAKNNNDN